MRLNYFSKLFALLLLIACSAFGQGAITLVQQVERGHGSQVTTINENPFGTFASAQSAGDANVIVVEYCGLPGGAGGGVDCLFGSNATGPIASVTDTAGNTYTKDCGYVTSISAGSWTTVCGGGTPTIDGLDVAVEVWSAKNIKSASGGNVVTANMTNTANMTGYNVWMFQLHPASGHIVLDKVSTEQWGTPNGGSCASPGIAASCQGPISNIAGSVTTTLSNEFQFGYCMTNNGTCPSVTTAGWTSAPLNGSTFYDTHSDAAYRIVSSTGTASVGFTAGSGVSEWYGLLVTYGTVAGNTYYISKSAGDDTRTSTQAQSKTTPWAHLPGMFSSTSNAASYTPVAGDSFILKGGDTWTNSDLGATLFQNGTAGNCVLPYGTGATSSCIYIGVDQTWFTGASWTRPVWDCGGSSCASWGTQHPAFAYMGCQYCVIDNIEMKGLFCSSAQCSIQFVFADQAHVEARNIYAHGWTHQAGAPTQLASFFSCDTTNDQCAGTVMDNNAIDGSDSIGQLMMWGSYGGGIERIFNNYYNYGPGFVSTWNFFYGNLVEHCTLSFDNNHGNCVFNEAPLSGNNVYQFNNIVRHATTALCAGCVKLWFMGASGPNASYVGYGFNNVIYDNDPSNIVNYTPSTGSGSNYGTYYLFNNTIQCGMDSSTGNCTFGATGSHPFTLFMQTNHWITSSSVCGPATCPNETNDLVQSVGQANLNTSPNFDQYNSSQTVAFSPVASTNSTVGQGNNNQTWCTTLTSLDAITGAACKLDAVYSGYNATNHTVTVPGRTQTSRPSSGAWDIGAYQFSGGAILSPPALKPAVFAENFPFDFSSSKIHHPESKR